ncbi:DnaJ domain-containing protein [bacterium]|nr:DnaJ domain-containing protein [bacterium]MCI0606135.1 DnaJ domain-containing protein [bacterium]
MKGISQLLIGIRLLSTIQKFSAQLSLFLDSGRVYLYCYTDKVLFVELGDLFPASWLAQTGMTNVAAKIRSTTSSQEKVNAFKVVSENAELRTSFADVVKKHLGEFFISDLKKCELKADPLLVSQPLFSLSELFSDCAALLNSNFFYQELLSSNDITFQLSADYLERSTKVKITLQQGYLLSRLEHSQSIQDIVPTVPADEETTKKNLLLLWSFGILDSTHLGRMLPRMDPSYVPGKGSESRVHHADSFSSDVRKQIEMIDQTYVGLSHKDYYTLLGVTTKADLPQIKTAYYRLARKFHPDRFYGLEDPVLKEKIDIIFSTINVAYETLKNQKSRHIYDTSSLDDKRISPSSVMSEPSMSVPESHGKVAEDYYQRAQKSYSSRNFFEAVQFLRSATQIAPDVAKYWRHLGIALSKNDQWRKEAEDSFQRAVDIEPENAENHLYLAFLYRNSALKLRAKRCFMKVLEIDPQNDVAKDQIAQIDAEESASQKKGLLDSFFKRKQ